MDTRCPWHGFRDLGRSMAGSEAQDKGQMVEGGVGVGDKEETGSQVVE